MNAKQKQAKENAIRWANMLIGRGRNLMIFDLETTHANPDKAQMVELGVINGLGETVYQTLVKPDFPIPPEASAIHGIDDDMVANAPEAGPVISSMHSMLRHDVTLTAYNFQYDWTVLQNSVMHHPQVGIDFQVKHKACAMKIWSSWNAEWNSRFNNWRWVKLTEAAVEAGLDTSGAHRAVDDCMMTLGILVWLARQEI